MRNLAITAALVAATVAIPAHAANLTGEYVIEGSCPAPNSAYRGTLSIQSQPNGLFHTLTWRVGSDTVVGRGMETEGRMAIEFRFANGVSGLMEVRRDGAHWRGTWATYGSDQLCTEVWTSR